MLRTMHADESTMPITSAQNDAVTPPSLIVESTKSASSDTGWKVRVPTGDVRVALSAIDNQLNADKAAWKGKQKDSNAAKEEFFMKCMDQTGKLLKRQLESVTVPADDAECALESYRTRMFMARSIDDNDDSFLRDEDGSLSSVDDEGEEIEFDDNEIIDQEAHDQVKQLRMRARELSARVISVREETAGRALEMTRRNISELIRVHGFSENTEEDDKDDLNEASERDDEEDEAKRNILNPMRVALQTLAASLQSVDNGLADKLDSMRETLGTIDASVEKYQKVAKGDHSGLSQTEKALFASEAAEEEMVAIESTQGLEEEEEEESSTTNPDRNLARLLAGIL